MDADIAIVGGGIVGTASALALQDAGMRAVVVEPNEPGAGTAEGSAGYLHDGEIFPLPHLDLLPALPALLRDPLGPLVFRAAYLPQLLPWSMRFLGAMRPRTREGGIEALAALNRLAIGEMLRMATAAGAQELIVRRGGLKVCRNPRALAVMERELAALHRHGIAAEMVDARRLHELEPAIAQDIAGGTFFADSAHCVDLSEFGRRLATRVRERGTIVKDRARAVEAAGDGSWLVRCASGETVTATRVLIAAGHASGEILAPLGYRVPLAPARGYHLMLADPGVELRRPVIFAESHFAATPMRDGLRLAGTMEFAAADAAPDMRRAEMLFVLAHPYLPGLQRTRAQTWMGVRPMSPDDLPMLGAARRHRGLYYAFGHGHLGLTQSAISARSIAELVTEGKPPIDLRPFDLARFA